jgi:hypothetical protein
VPLGSTAGDHPSPLLADAILQWGKDTIFVETDSPRLRVAKLRNRLKAYYDVRDGPEHRFFGGDLGLLVVTTLEGQRDRQWLWQASRLADERNVAPLHILVTTPQALREHGAGASIWRGLADKRRALHVPDR